MKRQYKLFYAWDHPREYSEMRYWWWHGWIMKGQIGFKLMGLYICLMWRAR